MKKLNYFFSLAFLVASLGLFTACGDDDDDTDNGPGGEDTETPATVVDVATADEDFSSLVAALTKADLVATLQGDGPYTVFAPTDAAFATFLEDNNFGTLEDVPTDVLTQVLLNHVVSGKVMSTDLTTGYTAGLASGPGETKVDLYVQTGATVMINDAKVTSADIVAGNGVVHVVDKVIAIPDVVDIALQNSDFSILVEALSRDDISDAMLIPTLQKDDGTYTVFAPTDDAFAALLVELNATQLSDISAFTLENALKYHVVAGSNVLAATLTDDQSVTTFQGSDFTINLENGAEITDARGRVAKIALTDVQASNGVVHVIDKVILHPAPQVIKEQ